jgi:hypothetical protein
MAELIRQQPDLNAVSDDTGQFDPRFVLWRSFCADRRIAVDNLSSDLGAEAKEQWDKLKESELGATSE